MSHFTYTEVGATRRGELPAGYRHLERRFLLGHGATSYRAAGEALLTWRLHRAIGARPTASAPRAAPGVTVTTRVGPVRIPCEVIWAEEAAFGYGTLAGHPFAGEESFRVTLSPEDEVWFTVRAFSRPATWYARLAGPLAPVFQRWYAGRCARKLRALA